MMIGGVKMLQLLRKSKYNEQALLDELRKYLNSHFENIEPVHRLPGYRLQHLYKMVPTDPTYKDSYLCLVTYVETNRWDSLTFHSFRVEFTSTGRHWSEI